MVNGAVAGEDGAAEQRRLGEGDALGGGQDAGRGDHRLLGERGDVQAGVQVGAVVGAAGVHVGGAGERVGAQPHLAERAGVAGAAGGGPVEDDLVAGRDVGDALADGDDGAGTLVAEDGGQRHPHGAVGQGQVGVADPGGGEPHPDPAGAGLGQLDAGDLQRGPRGGYDGGTDCGTDGHDVDGSPAG